MPPAHRTRCRPQPGHRPPLDPKIHSHSRRRRCRRHCCWCRCWLVEVLSATTPARLSCPASWRRPRQRPPPPTETQHQDVLKARETANATCDHHCGLMARSNCGIGGQNEAWLCSDSSVAVAVIVYVVLGSGGLARLGGWYCCFFVHELTKAASHAAHILALDHHGCILTHSKSNSLTSSSATVPWFR